MIMNMNFQFISVYINFVKVVSFQIIFYFKYLEYNTFNWLHISFLPGLHQIANAIIKRSKLTIRIKRKTFGLLMPKNEKIVLETMVDIDKKTICFCRKCWICQTYTFI